MPKCKSRGRGVSNESGQGCSSVKEDTEPQIHSPISSRTRRSTSRRASLQVSPIKSGAADLGKSTVTSNSKKRQSKPKGQRSGKSAASGNALMEPMEVVEYDHNMSNHIFSQKVVTVVDQSSADSNEEEEVCAVCMCPPTNPKELEKCGHKFCTTCIEQCFKKMKPACPICGTLYGKIVGNMPRGTMTHHTDPYSQLPGYEGHGTIMIEYNFPNGIQTEEHPHPGRQYYGTHRVAFLPNNAEGQKVLRLLKQAFESRVTFTVGRSATTGLDDQVIWNDVHHKTRVCGGPTSFGYPDPTYLNRVQEELASKGVF